MIAPGAPPSATESGGARGDKNRGTQERIQGPTDSVVVPRVREN
jgi:hypothetical protein